MYDFDVLNDKFIKLKNVYSSICNDVNYDRREVATEYEIEELERKLSMKLPISLKNVLLNFSKEFNFRAHLSEGFQLPKELEGIFSAVFEISLEEILYAEKNRVGWVEECFPDENDTYDKVWHNKLGFISVPNGDVIAFDLEDNKDDPKVVYLSHDDGEGHGVVLGNNFIDYMERIIAVGCCGNEDWQMIPFIKNKYDGIIINCENAKTYRKLINLEW